MLFASYEFFLFLVAIFPLGIVCKQKVAPYKLFLLCVNLAFYRFWGYQFLIILLVSVLSNYLIIKGLSVTKAKAWYYFGLIFNLGYLGVFKYFNFFADSLFQLLNQLQLQPSLSVVQIIAPVGISFYTFRLISHLVETSPPPPETPTPVAKVQLVQLLPAIEKEADTVSTDNPPEAPPQYERFLLVGDSTMYDLSIALNDDLRKQYQIKNIRADYRASTGLNRRDYYDWYQKTPQFIQEYQADVLIAIFGGNENQGIRDNNGKYHPISSPSWQSIYQQRVEEYAQLISNSSIKKMYWVGQPISNVTRVNQFYPVINQIYKTVSEKYEKIEFVDTWNAFAVEGRFSPVMRDQSGQQSYVRVNDGVHFTRRGARILGQRIIDRLVQDQIIQPFP